MLREQVEVGQASGWYFFPYSANLATTEDLNPLTNLCNSLLCEVCDEQRNLCLRCASGSELRNGECVCLYNQFYSGKSCVSCDPSCQDGCKSLPYLCLNCAPEYHRNGDRCVASSKSPRVEESKTTVI